MHPFAGRRIDKVAGVEARGFVLGGADRLRAAGVPVSTMAALARR